MALIAPESLTWVCPPEWCGAAKNGGPPVFGQERALSALRLGLALQGPGYHVFVTGVAGSGRRSAVLELLQQQTARGSALRDLVYVHNFNDAARPHLLTLPAGWGQQLARGMAELVKEARSRIPALFESESFQSEQERISKQFREQHEARLEALQARLAPDGLGLVTSEEPGSEPEIVPVVEGSPASIDVLRADSEALATFFEAHPSLGEPSVAILAEKIRAYGVELGEIWRESRRMARVLAHQIGELQASAAQRALADLFDDLGHELPDASIRVYLEQVAAHMRANLAPLATEEEAEALRLYGVNVLVDRTGVERAPVVAEANPTFTNLFGSLEADTEGARANFLQVRAGSLLRADGGYLVLYARDVLLESSVWRVLVRSLRAASVEIQPPEQATYAPVALKPEPIPVALKVVLLGDEGLYQMLSEMDADFAEVFKVKAEFESWAETTEANVRALAAQLHRVAHRECLPPLDSEAVALLIEHAARRAGSQRRLSLQLGVLTDVMREAAHGTTAKIVTAARVREALAAQRERHDLARRNMDVMLRERMLLVDTEGSRVGQVNGLAVLGLDPHTFAVPVRISATVGAGRGGVVDIEREAELSGSIHDKGVLLLSGWLRRTYGRKRPLSLTASIAVEQSYTGIDGDSASLAELLALLSALTDLPARQNVGVTGAVSQLGDVHPVGGVDQKMSAFGRLLLSREQTGAGVVPMVNAADLMLEPDLLQAVQQGRFVVYGIRSVDEAIPLVFGVSADELHQRAHQALAELGHELATETESRRTLSGPWSPNKPEPPRDPKLPGPGR